MTFHSANSEQQLWDDWILHEDSNAGNQLIQNYIYLVSFHVERMTSHLPRNVQKEELHSLGLYGLFDALRKFDPKRGFKFDTYASFRIKGAMVDGLRKKDWLPRSLREKSKRIQQASEHLEQQYARAATSKEIADYTQLTMEEVESIAADTLFANTLSMDEKISNDKGEVQEGVGYNLPGDAQDLPEQRVVENEWKQELTESIKALNEKEQMVISLFYFDELTLTEIGEVLDLTTSRISQIHKKAIFKLRNILGELGDA